MEGYTHKCTLVFLALVLLWKISIALPIDSTEIAPIQDTLVNTNNPDIDELVQIQAETIKKILSASRAAAEQDKKLRKDCDEIETSIKETLSKSDAEEQKEIEHQDDDQVAESSEPDIVIRENDRREDVEAESSVPQEETTEEEEEIASESSVSPNGRTLFTYYKTTGKDNGLVQNITTSKVETTVTEETRTYTEGQNIILIPCMKKIDGAQIPNAEATRRFVQNTNALAQNQNVHIHLPTDKPVAITTGKVEPAQALVLEKIYSPSGQFLYYMYKARNVPPQKEDLQPAYINAPVPYSPTYHLIRTLAIPSEDGQYVLKENPSLEKKK
ncbi:hypothetical protein CBL_02819 [Carabus blaptoides fortunei]